VTIKAGDEPGCKQQVAGLTAGTDYHNDATSEAQVKENKAQRLGTASTVQVVAGAKDSDYASSTWLGDAVFTPAFIVMGHELIHALHNSRGVRRRKIEGPGIEWTNMEEYHTIFGGKLSEQTLRDQIGLFSERFGHNKMALYEPAAVQAHAEVVRVASVMERRRSEVDKRVEQCGFDPKGLADKTKLAIADADPEVVADQLPPGWNVNDLSVRQMHGIVAKQIQFKLKELGWSVLDLPQALGEGQTIEAVTRDMVPHPRSGMARRANRAAKAGAK